MIRSTQETMKRIDDIIAEREGTGEEKFARWLAGHEQPGVGDSALRVDCRRGIFTEKRDLSTATGSAGGYAVGEQLVAAIAERLQARNVFWKWARILESAAGLGLATMPSVDDTANAAALEDENGTRATATDITYGQVTFSSYKIDTGILPCSNELVRDSQLFTESVGRLLAKRVDVQMAELLTTGAGTTEPTGVVTGATNSSVSGMTVSPSVDALLDLKYSVSCEWHESPKAAFMCHPTIWRNAKKAFGAEAAAFFRPKDSPDGTDFFDGSAVILNRFMPVDADSKGVLFGDFYQFVAMIRREIYVNRLVERYATAYQTGFSAYIRVDSQVAVGSAIKYGTL